MKTDIDFPSVIQKFDAILTRGLCSGIGKPNAQMCIEAAITQALGLPFSDDPECVARAVRRYKIAINDSAHWKSPASRAEALRDIGIAQIGSRGVVDDREFAKRLAAKTARVLIPALFRDMLSHDARCMAAADRCEREGTVEALREATYAATYAADAATYAATAAADAATAATAADAAAAAKKDPEKYLRLSVSLALDVLRELKSPGCAWIEERAL